METPFWSGFGPRGIFDQGQIARPVPESDNAILEEIHLKSEKTTIISSDWATKMNHLRAGFLYN